MKEGFVGKPAGRMEGFVKAQGKALYAGDYRAADMLHLALVRAPVAHGHLKMVDASALSEGVRIFTAKDVADNIIEDVIEDQPLLAVDRIRFCGEPVAVVAAESREEARLAAAQVRVVCEELPAVVNVWQAAAPDCLPLHEKGNLLNRFDHEKGDVAQAFAASDLILEGDFSTPVQDHGYMEPEACFCQMEAGRLRAFTSTQNVFHDRRMICRCLGLAEEQVQVKAAVVGGGFGGKDGNTAQIFTALVTWLTGRPAKLVFDREESLAASYKRHAAEMHVKMGFSRDGRILAFDGSGLLDTGAYAALGPAVLGLFSEHFAGPYQIPNVRISSRLYYTNKPPAHAMRGFGAPQGAFATEMLISRACRQLGLDPVQMRLQNALEPGAAGALGQRMEHCVDFKGALRQIAQSSLWQERERNRDPLVAYGIAGGHLSCGLGKNIPDTAKVSISAAEEGYRIRIGFVDIGQGSATALRAMAADALETLPEKIELILADTDETFDCGSAAGSRSTFIAGNAMLAAIRRFREEGGPAAAVSGEAAFPEAAESFATPGFPHAMYTFIAQAVKLRVNPVTGMPELLEIAAATEAGRVINPLSMAGQIQGGVAMSVGFALGEDCCFREGCLLNRDFSTYLMPTALDVPAITSLHVDAYETSGPMGVKGAAEVSTVSIAPAIGAALEEVSQVQLSRLPFDINTIAEAMIHGQKEEKNEERL